VFRSIGGIRFFDFGRDEVNWRELDDPRVVFRGDDTADSGLILDVRECRAAECLVIPGVEEIGRETNPLPLGYLEILVSTPRRTNVRDFDQASEALAPGAVAHNWTIRLGPGEGYFPGLGSSITSVSPVETSTPVPEDCTSPPTT
jgi:hypothetical protein